jgi:cell division protein FtsB
MEWGYQLRRHLRSAVVPALCVLAIAYFGYHGIEGERGLVAYARLVEDVQRAEALWREAAKTRQRLEARVSLLHPEHIDADMLDERARQVLGVAHPDDVIVYPEEQRPHR